MNDWNLTRFFMFYQARNELFGWAQVGLGDFMEIPSLDLCIYFYGQEH